MARIIVRDISGTGEVVSASHFGANTVYKVNTDSGKVSDGFTNSAGALGISHVRYPAGQGDHADPSGEGTDWLNIVKLHDGRLRPELTDFLDWCVETNTKATLVIPTKFLSAREYAGFGNEIAIFVELLTSDYANVVEALEIGNEYWEMGESEYAAKANIAVQALADGLDAAGLSKANQPAILVQMATPNAGSHYHVDADNMAGIPYHRRVDMANQHILDRLDAETFKMIDGVVEHYYYSRTRDVFTRQSDERGFIDRDFNLWQSHVEHDLELHITEWNVKASNIAENGIRSASTLIHQFDQMIEMGADAASIWAVQHNTPTDLTGNAGDHVIFDNAGRVVSTMRGALFDMLEEAIAGLDRLDIETKAPAGVTLAGYGGADSQVVYISSRLFETTEFRIDFNALSNGFGFVSGMILGYNPETSDGRHYDPYNDKGWVSAQGLDLSGDGEIDYFVNEHDTRANFTDLTQVDLVSNETINFTLQPYEVIQLTFSAHEPQMLRGGDGNDSLAGSGGDDVLMGFSGADRLVGRGGDDELMGGRGQDWMIGGSGDDTIIAARGRDAIFGKSGDDYLKGGSRADVLVGGFGADVLKGGRGQDRLVGGKGDDTMTGGGGADFFEFRGGNDTILDFAGEDTILVRPSLAGSEADLARAIQGAQIIAGNTVIEFGEAGSLLLVGFNNSDGLSTLLILG